MAEIQLELRAQVALDLTEQLAERAAAGEADTDDREQRRRSFLDARAHVERLAKRETRDGTDAIAELLRIAKIGDAAFDDACNRAIDLRDTMASDLMDRLRSPRPRRELRGTCGAAHDGGCTKFGNTVQSGLTAGSPRWSMCETIKRVAKMAVVMAMLAGCGDQQDSERRSLVEIDCGGSPCVARWDETDLWSPVYPIDDVTSLPDVDPSTLWACESSPDPDFVFCVEVDGLGHVGCFRDEGDWAVAVAPTCAVGSLPDWIDVGAGMSAQAFAR